MNLKLMKNIMPEDSLRQSFNALVMQTFDFSFEEWYQAGYAGQYLPYTLFDGERAVANVSVNRMELLFQGKIHRYIQLGTVMTDEAYRGRGLSRILMKEVLKDWETQCEGIFLFANQSVLDFYPKFGFQRCPQTQYRIVFHERTAVKAKLKSAETIPGIKQAQAAEQVHAAKQAQAVSWRKLDMEKEQDRKLLERCYAKGNPFSGLQVIHNFNLLMFYGMSVMKDCIYYSGEYDAVVIAKQDGDFFQCYDIFCDEYVSGPQELLKTIAPLGTESVILNFTPKSVTESGIRKEKTALEGCIVEDEDDALFVLGDKGDIFRNGMLYFPVISHT